MNLSRAVLLPIDMQQAFDDPGWPQRWNGDVDRNGLALLDAWRGTGRPLIHVRHDSVEEHSLLRPERPGNAFRPGFGPQGDEAVVAKSANAAFIGTDLELRLRRLDADTVVVFGITTDHCVSTTVRVGANLGFRMVLVEDACDCSTQLDGTGAAIPARDVHRVHVASLRGEFARVVSTAGILEELRGRGAA